MSRKHNHKTQQVDRAYADKLRQHLADQNAGEKTIDFLMWMLNNKKADYASRVNCAKLLIDICGLKELPPPQTSTTGTNTIQSLQKTEDVEEELQQLLSRSEGRED